MKKLKLNIIRSFALSSLFTVSLNYGSIFNELGMGLETSPYTARTIGMGHAGMASLNLQGLSLQNPSITGFNNRTTFEAILETELNYIQDDNYSNTIGLSRLPMLGASFQGGMLGQISGYYFQRFDKRFEYKLESDTSIQRVNNKAGNFEMVVTWGKSLGKYFAVGLSSHHLFGSEKQIRETDFLDNNLDSLRDTIDILRNGWYPGFSTTFRRGAFSTAFSGNFIPMKFEAEETKKVNTQNSEGTVVVGKQNFPLRFNLGFSYRFKIKHNLVADGSFTHWDSKVGKKVDQAFHTGLGYEFRGMGGIYDSYHKKISYRAGMGYEKLYVDDVNLWRATLGLGLPFGRRGSSMDLALEYGHRGDIGANLAQEDYIKFFVSLTGAGIWGQTRRRQ